MIAFAYYLLKVIICSGILFLYYHSALRNKLFHQWNRFYLLAAVLLSIIAPIIQINIVHHSAEEKNTAIQLLQVIQGNDYLDAIVINSRQSFSAEQWMMMLYAFISLIFFTAMMISLIKIFFVIQSHTAQWLHNIKFINTNLRGTPFSFFHFIFWNEKIDLQTETGLQIFQHELVHVKEKHTIDKLLMQIILILFWCNPFFWLIRKELKIIHEFIADKKAVGQQGTAALAAMILNSTYPSHFNSLTNQFFQTSIKRRLVMLTKIQNPKMNYFSRILALPIIAFIFFAFTLRVKKPSVKSKNISAIHNKYSERSRLDTTPLLNGSVSLHNISQDTINGKTILEASEITFNSFGKGSDIKTLAIVNGKRMNVLLLEGKKIISKKIILYDKNNKEAINLYGEVAKNGVIIFEDAVVSNAAVEKNNADTFSRLHRKPFASENALYVLNGKEVSKAESDKIDPNSIQSINVLKGKSATTLYGEKGSNGVIEITTKSNNGDEKPENENASQQKNNDRKQKDTIPETKPLLEHQD